MQENELIQLGGWPGWRLLLLWLPAGHHRHQDSWRETQCLGWELVARAVGLCHTSVYLPACSCGFMSLPISVLGLHSVLWSQGCVLLSSLVPPPAVAVGPAGTPAPSSVVGLFVVVSPFPQLQ